MPPPLTNFDRGEDIALPVIQIARFNECSKWSSASSTNNACAEKNGLGYTMVN